MSDTVVSLRGDAIAATGAVADEDTVRIIREALARALRGEVQSVVFIGIESNLESGRIRHLQGQLHARLAIAGLKLEADSISAYLNSISQEKEPVAPPDEPA